MISSSQKSNSVTYLYNFKEIVQLYVSNNVLVSLIFYAIQGFDIFEINSHKHNSQRDAILINT